MIDLVARKQKLTEEIVKVDKDIQQLQAALQTALQAKERMLGAMILLDELLTAEESKPNA
jgi:hypothetical protein